VADQVARSRLTGSWRTLGLRIASSVVLAPLALAALWLGGAWLFVLVLICAGLLAREWQRVTYGTAHWATTGVFVLGAGVAGMHAELAREAWSSFALHLAIWIAIASVVQLYRGRPIAWALAGAIYVLAPSVLLLWLRSEPVAGRDAVLWLVLSVWATDMGAYVAGRTIGGPKLAPRISPNKTWAGLIGGMLLAAATGAFMAAGSGLASVTGLALWSMLLAVVAQAGDLTESPDMAAFSTVWTGCCSQL
jgi:phosphatidate cytidylyltransferase